MADRVRDVYRYRAVKREVRSLLVVGPRHNPPLTDELVLGIELGDRQAVLLPTGQISALSWALIARGVDGWSSHVDASGSFVEVRQTDDGVTLTVTGYGHAWKRRSVELDVIELVKLSVALDLWLTRGWDAFSNDRP